MTTETRREFPDGFWWGAATAAHQVEGNNVNSDWWAREFAPGTDVVEPSGDAADSYHRYREDIELLARSGLTMYRFSVEWSRIEPEPGFVSTAQLLHYRNVIDTCHEFGVEPMVTLLHFTHPRWFARLGGWRNPEAPALFERFVETVAPILHDVTWICTINECNMMAMTRNEEGTDMAAAALPAPDEQISHALVDGHRRARATLAEVLPHARTGWTIATQAFHAMPGCEAETDAYRYPREDFFLEAAAGDDWVGVQAYLRTFIGKDGPVPVPDDVEKTLTGWEYFPASLQIGVRNAWKLGGGTPVFVTENGLATSDDQRRVDYTYDALAGLHDAMADGVEVLGYLHWSLLDNYEWGSYTPTFGLVAWDRETFERNPRPSLAWLGGVAASGVLRHPDR